MNCIPAFAVSLLLAAAATAQPISATAFDTVGLPILGLQLERAAGTDRHRLVRIDDQVSRVIATGDRARCEQRRVQLLEIEHGSGFLNLAIPTLGGRQFWADELVNSGWRIQRNHFTGRFRLLDDEDVRRAWGDFEGCRVVLEKARVDGTLKTVPRHAVVLLHGLGRSRHCFAELAGTLRARGYGVVTIGYPSTRGSVEDHAAQVNRVLDRLEGPRRLSFVTHSLGGLVARQTLSTNAAWKKRIKVGRLVMLGPPNNGSLIADKLAGAEPVQAIAGDAIEQLASAGTAKIPLPTCPFGVIAGGRGDRRGLNPLIPGDDDGVVTVETTKLPGMADFALVEVWHSRLVRDPDVQEHVLRFLADGHFE